MRTSQILGLIVSVFLLILVTACGGGGAVDDNVPNIQMSVDPFQTSLDAGETQQFTATVTGSTNTAVTWAVSGTNCTGSACGTISSSGLYTAPDVVPTTITVRVSATSQANSGLTMSSTVTLNALSVDVTPSSMSVEAGESYTMTASVTHHTNKAVTWSLTGTGCSGTGCGTLDANSGLYTAPALIPSQATVVVTATSVADPTKSDTCSVTLVPLSITISPTTATLVAGETLQFAASVMHHSNTAVTWSVSGSGSVSNVGLYTAPSVLSGQQAATVTATSVADPTKSASAAITLIPLLVTVAPTTAFVSLNDTQQFTATVKGSTNTSVTWSVSGSGCSLSGCGTIDTNGLYTAPNALPSPATVTVTATSVADNTVSGTATITLIGDANGRLIGQYAFSFQGFDSTGQMVAVVGSFTADGNGLLTDGLRDVNSVSGSRLVQQAFDGTYQIHSDGRGVLNFDAPSMPSFRIALADNGEKGYMVEVDGTGTHGSGVLKRATAGDFLLSRVTGDYAFGLEGNGVTGERNALVGRFHADGAGNISDGSLDANDLTTTSFSGSLALSSTTGSANGRGTMIVTIPGQAPVNGVFYMVDRDELLFLVTDAVGTDQALTSGSMLRQSGAPFSSSSLTGSLVFYSNAVVLSNQSAVFVGSFVSDGSSNLSLGEFARNWAGTPAPVQNFDATYSIANNGRGTFQSTTFGEFVFYMIEPNKAFLLQYSGAGTGLIENQTLPTGGLTNANITDRYFTGTVGPALYDAGSFATATTFDGAGAFTQTRDRSWVGGDLTDDPVDGTYNVTSSTNGRATFATTSPGVSNMIFYAVSDSKFYVINVDAGVTVQSVGIIEK